MCEGVRVCNQIDRSPIDRYAKLVAALVTTTYLTEKEYFSQEMLFFESSIKSIFLQKKSHQCIAICSYPVAMYVVILFKKLNILKLNVQTTPFKIEERKTARQGTWVLSTSEASVLFMFYECSLRPRFPHVLCMSSVCSECALNCIDHVVILSEYSDTAVGLSENFKNSSSPLLCGELLEELKIFNMFLVALPQVDLEELKNIQNVALPRVYLVVHDCVRD